MSSTAEREATQEGRLLSVTTPLGKDKLLLRGLEGREGMSSLFQFDLVMVSEDGSISFDDIVGKNVTVNLELVGGAKRNFNGLVSRFTQTGRDEHFVHYRAEVVPWLWMLTRHSDCRIFQNKNVPDIIGAVFGDRGFSDYRLSLQGSYSPLEYCVQYRETDFNFVTRLMEQCGIFFFFEHSASKHTLVLADAATAHEKCPGPSKVEFTAEGTGVHDDDVITNWSVEQEVRPGKYTLRDYNFETPSVNLEISAPTTIKASGADARELYDYPGDYLKRADGEKVVKLRMQEEEVGHLVATGAGNCRNLASGYKFTLAEHFNDDVNGDYVLTEVRHSARSGSYYGAENGGGDEQNHYANTFTCIPSDRVYRPARITPRPVVHGTQTAVVVGKSGEEIWVDKYGRVKVQFFWDREGKSDEQASCWVRVSQSWAGKEWGWVALPRIGQEVLVQFLEGDPDHPIITGRVYNANQMPPYTLPANQTQTGIKTRSSPKGGADNFNELRFEDKKGSEEIHVQAEKDLTIVIKNDETRDIKHARTTTIKADDSETVSEGNQTIAIKKGDQSTTLDEGNQSMTLTKGNQSITLTKGNQTIKLDSGNQEVTLSQGNQTIKLSLGNQSTKLDVGKATTEAMQGIELKVGGNSIKIDQTGITIKGLMVKVEGEVQTSIKGAITQVNGDGMLQLKGGITMIN
ncbi:MAG: type VI secretion system Vgr family protein [Gemmatimonadaceae bacterium]